MDKSTWWDLNPQPFNPETCTLPLCCTRCPNNFKFIHPFAFEGFKDYFIKRATKKSIELYYSPENESGIFFVRKMATLLSPFGERSGATTSERTSTSPSPSTPSASSSPSSAPPTRPSPGPSAEGENQTYTQCLLAALIPEEKCRFF